MVPLGDLGVAGEATAPGAVGVEGQERLGVLAAQLPHPGQFGMGLRQPAGEHLKACRRRAALPHHGAAR